MKGIFTSCYAGTAEDPEKQVLMDVTVLGVALERCSHQDQRDTLPKLHS